MLLCLPLLLCLPFTHLTPLLLAQLRWYRRVCLPPQLLHALLFRRLSPPVFLQLQ